MRTHYQALIAAVICSQYNLTVHNMLIPDAPAVGDMSESAPTVPEAAYNGRVHKAEYVAVPKTKEAKGPYIKVQWVITGPGESKYIGRMVFCNYSLTQDGNFRLRELLTVTNHPTDFVLKDSDNLIGLECGLAVIVKEATVADKEKGYSDKNEIKKHLPLLGMEAAAV